MELKRGNESSGSIEGEHVNNKVKGDCGGKGKSGRGFGYIDETEEGKRKRGSMESFEFVCMARQNTADTSENSKILWSGRIVGRKKTVRSAEGGIQWNRS